MDKDSIKRIEDKCKEDGNYSFVIKDLQITRVNRILLETKPFTIVLVGLLCFVILWFMKYLIFSTSVSSNTQISIKAVTEKSTLEVLSISDSVIVIENEKNNSEGITAWTKFTGKGCFVVDLQNSEFLIDQARKTVIVKTPDVSIDKEHFTLDYNDTENLFFNDKGFNESYRTGIEIAENQYNEAYVRIFEQLYTNPYYYDSAQNAAEKIIASLVKNFNKDIDGLTVIVEIGALSEFN